MLAATKIKKLQSLVLNYTAVAFGPPFGLKISGETGQSPPFPPGPDPSPGSATVGLV